MNPFQQPAERRAAMTVLGFFLRCQFREGFFNLRKIKQRIVAEAVRTARRIENHTFRRAAKGRQCFSIARHRQHSNKSSSPLGGRNAPQLAKYTGVVGLVIGVGVRFVRFLVQ